MRQSLTRACRRFEAGNIGVGLYSGITGVAVAAAIVGTALEAEEFLIGASGILDQLASRGANNQEFDLMEGSAGATVGCLALGQLLKAITASDMAVIFADRLLASAIKDENRYSWSAPESVPTVGNLTGFSHGAAGAGYALLEMFQATRNVEYYLAAMRAFEYERQLYSPEAHNWPDLRGARSRGEISRPVAFGASWCHGAPGIALSRLRAYRLVGDEKCRDEANIALGTTHKIVAAALHSRTGNYSLCHGLSGNAEVLMYGSDVLGAQWTHCRTLVLETAKVGMETYGSSPQAWRCGTPAGETPSLLLGLAGIGLFYLRLYDSTIPSILILEPEEFGKATRSNMAEVRSI